VTTFAERLSCGAPRMDRLQPGVGQAVGAIAPAGGDAKC